MICYDSNCSYDRTTQSTNGRPGNEKPLYCSVQNSLEKRLSSPDIPAHQKLCEISEVIFKYTVVCIFLWSFAFDVLIWCVGIVSDPSFSKRKRASLIDVIVQLMLYCSQPLFGIFKENQLNSVGDTVGINVYSVLICMPYPAGHTAMCPIPWSR